jgi:Domain of unknown function (DUF4268)
LFDKKLKDEFWTTFGKYMALHPSASGEKVNWINYKTGVKLVQFRLEVNEKKAGIYIELLKAELEVQKKLFNQLNRDIDLLIGYTDANWLSESQSTTTEGRIISRIYQERPDVNVYFKSDWPAIISFLKFELIGVDKFWTEQKDLYAFMADS